MILDLALGTILVILIAPMIWHWCVFLFSRYSKSMDFQRRMASLLAKTAANLQTQGKQPHTPIIKTKSKDEDDIGYA